MSSDDKSQDQPGEASAGEVAALRREVKALRAQLAKYSMVDPATEIASAAYFAEFFDRRWRTHARRGDQPLSVVLIEPDGFEAIDDAAEPAQVDRWLRQIARTIEACATRAGDIAARCDEHTFAMVLSETDADGAAQIAKKIQDTVDALAIEFGDGQLTVSVGLATATPTAVTGQRQFIASAERALEALGHHPAFGFNYDPSHLGYQGVDYVKFIRKFHDRIFHVHMKDSYWSEFPAEAGVFGGHVDFHQPNRYWDFKSVGRGSVDFELIIRALNDIGYAGPLSVEWEDGGMDREHGAAESAEYCRKVDFPPSNIVFDAQFAD